MKNVFSTSLKDRRIQAARRYSSFDKSDPHAFNRAVSHINNGIVGFRTAKVNGKEAEVPCDYDSDVFTGSRDPDPRWAPIAHLGTGRVVQVTVTTFRNIRRP